MNRRMRRQATRAIRSGFVVAWAQVRHGKWEVLTGQSWSLLTPTRIGLSPAPEDIFTALRLDTSYLAGMVYSRQPGVRFTYRPNKWSTLAIALENPDQFVPSSVVFPTDGSTNFFSTQFDNGSSNTSAIKRQLKYRRTESSSGHHREDGLRFGTLQARRFTSISEA